MQPDVPSPFDIPSPTPQNPRPLRAKLYGPGRPRALDDGKLREICALIAGGCGLGDAARYVNCSVSTIRREADRNPAFLEQIQHAEKQARLKPLRAMQQAMGTHWRAAAWFLERAFPERFSRPEPSAFGQREARGLMKEILAHVDNEVRNAFYAKNLRKGIRRSFARYIRTATDRRQNAHNLRVTMRSLEDAPETADVANNIDSLTDQSQLQTERPSDFDQKLTAENPFVRRSEPLQDKIVFFDACAERVPAGRDVQPEPAEFETNANEFQSLPDFNIQ